MNEFRAGILRSMKQYNAGLVKTFDNVDEFLDDLHQEDIKSLSIALAAKGK